jgi:4,5:9,10-diseco-3-hydroxy-5,9,17-trioxoandrosta-1(10),2-diene-4-oate hydrolase
VRDLFVHKELVTDEVIDAMWAPGTFHDNLRSIYLLERGLDWRVTALDRLQYLVAHD